MIGNRIEVNIAGGLDVELPGMVGVRQKFKTPAIDDITGRNARATEWELKPDIKKIAVLGLIPETDGYATGLSGADVITMRLYRDFDPEGNPAPMPSHGVKGDE